jgi:hypothetical protein
MYIKKSA